MPSDPDLDLKQRLAALPPRGRTAIALSAAAQAATLLAAVPQAHAAANDGLDLARRWQAGARVSARSLYERIHPLLAFEPLMSHSPRIKAALFAVVAALYYCTHVADKENRSIPSLPDDMGEVDDEMAATCLDYAAEAADDSAAARKVQLDAVERGRGA